MKRPLLIIAVAATLGMSAQNAIINEWMMNTTGDMGSYQYYQTMPSGNLTTVNMTDSTDVLKVCYNNTHVYVSADGLANYQMGPFLSNPNQPAAKNYVFKFTRTPAQETGTHQSTIGTVGVTVNGLKMYGPSDARSYKSTSNSNVSNGDGLWWSDAWISEGTSMDATGNGHPDANGNYHHHANPIQLYSDPSTSHSPIIGFALDGYPVYGPYGYSSATNSSSGITRMQSSYQLRNITVRTTLPDGTTSSPAGPAVSSSFPLGTYIEDYEYVSGSGTLDEYNGRYCVTPEYPSGTYAYFMTTKSNGDPAYPYFLTGEFYGVITLQDMQTAGSATIPSTNITCYTGASVGINEIAPGKMVSVYPVPASDVLYFNLNGGSSFEVKITNLTGQLVDTRTMINGVNEISLEGLQSGVYFVTVKDESGSTDVIRFIKD